MKTVQEVYDAYRIMPALQLHQLRVAAAGKIICENSTRESDAHSIILAGLFHDMANIIKSDLTTFPDFVEPEGEAHWRLVKEEFVARYGRSEHQAALAIAGEIGLPEKVRRLIGRVGFSNLADIRDSDFYEQKIVEYCDLRVGPHGVLSLTARIDEAKNRYATKHPDLPRTEDEFERLRAAAYTIEEQIFAEADIAPEDISEDAVKPILEELRALRLS